jgi:hypothetical protein
LSSYTCHTLSRISKQDKLKQQFQCNASEAASKKSTIFDGVHVYVNGYTEPDSLTIKNMLAAHGGVWEQYNGRCKALHACIPYSAAAAASFHLESQCWHLHLLQSSYPHSCEPASVQQNSEISECCKSQERCKTGLGRCLRGSWYHYYSSVELQRIQLTQVPLGRKLSEHNYLLLGSNSADGVVFVSFLPKEVFLRNVLNQAHHLEASMGPRLKYYQRLVPSISSGVLYLMMTGMLEKFFFPAMIMVHSKLLLTQYMWHRLLPPH